MADKNTKSLLDWNRWLQRVLRRKHLRTEEVALVADLERFLEEYPDETPLEKWLGFLYIMIGRDKDAERLFSRLTMQYAHDIEVQNALAYVFLRQGKTEQAATHLLDALYNEEGHPLLKRNLDLLRSADNLTAWLDTHTWKDFVFFALAQNTGWDVDVQEILRHPLFRLALVGGVILAIGGAVFVLYPTLINVAQRYQQIRRRETGALIENFTIQDIEKLVEERQRFSIKLTEEEVSIKFETLKELLYEGRRNQALRIINELLNSNASERVKEHVRIYESFVPPPDPKNIDYNPSCRQVLRTPFLYKDVYINWVGTVANLFFYQRKETSFDLLINFIDEATVEGIASVKVPGFESDLRNGRKVRVFGRIAGVEVDNKVVILDPQIHYLD